MGIMVLTAIFCMGVLSFASVPLYKLFCAKTGFDGTTQRSSQLPARILDRSVAVEFFGRVDKGLNWDFNPEIRQVKVKLGQKGLIAFHARNRESRPVGGTAIYNVTPLKVGKYFQKVQCFCFDEQILRPGEDISMPVMFYIDPAMNDDPDMDDVSAITLSYTFYRAESNELEDAFEAFYNKSGSDIQGAN
jgi:cytochrome c oxidase assembly protein subunit 11